MSQKRPKPKPIRLAAVELLDILDWQILRLLTLRERRLGRLARKLGRIVDEKLAEQLAAMRKSK